MLQRLACLVPLLLSLSCVGQGMKISQYPATNQVGPNQLFIITAGGTNMNVRGGVFASALALVPNTNGYSTNQTHYFDQGPATAQFWIVDGGGTAHAVMGFDNTLDGVAVYDFVGGLGEFWMFTTNALNTDRVLRANEPSYEPVNFGTLSISNGLDSGPQRAVTGSWLSNTVAQSTNYDVIAAGTLVLSNTTASRILATDAQNIVTNLPAGETTFLRSLGTNSYIIGTSNALDNTGLTNLILNFNVAALRIYTTNAFTLTNFSALEADEGTVEKNVTLSVVVSTVGSVPVTFPTLGGDQYSVHMLTNANNYVQTTLTNVGRHLFNFRAAGTNINVAYTHWK